MAKVADEMQITLPLKRFNELLEASEKVIHLSAKLDQLERSVEGCRKCYFDVLQRFEQIS